MKYWQKGKLLKLLGGGVILTILLELFIFNFRTFQSMGYQSEDLTNLVTYNGMEVGEDGTVTITDPDNNYLEIEHLDRKLNNIKLDLELSGIYAQYQISATDEANALYLDLPTKYLYPAMERSKYVKLNLYGNSEKIKIHFINYSGTFKVNKISINEKVPFRISYLRMVLVFSVIFCIAILRSNSSFYKIKLNFKNKYQVGIMAGSVVFITFLFGYFMVSNPTTKITGAQHLQYYELTNALLKGQPYLDIQPSEELLAMENPYDFYLRSNMETELNKKIGVWDHSFYNGKYYVYFGIGPVLFGYLPYHVIFGKNLSHRVAVLVISFFTLIGMILFLKEICKRYFKNIPFLLFMLMYCFLATTLLGIVESPCIYTVPIIYAMLFTYWGLYFMVLSIQKEHIRTPYLFFGSLCMALVASCRPQFLVGSFLLIPLFWDSIFKEQTLFSKKAWKQTLAFLLPYVAVAIPLMTYNYVRFGSITDFGATYQITNVDMTRRGFDFERIGFGLFTLLFQLPVLRAVFPFITKSSTLTNYMGKTNMGSVYGGMLTTNLLLWIGVFSYKFKQYLPKKLYHVSWLSIVMAFVVLIFDIQVSGVASRYLLDVAWLVFLPTIFVVFGLFNSDLSKQIKKVILTFILIALGIYFLYQFQLSIQDFFRHDLIHNLPNYYFKWHYLLQWWL